MRCGLIIIIIIIIIIIRLVEGSCCSVAATGQLITEGMQRSYYEDNARLSSFDLCVFTVQRLQCGRRYEERSTDSEECLPAYPDGRRLAISNRIYQRSTAAGDRRPGRPWLRMRPRASLPFRHSSCVRNNRRMLLSISGARTQIVLHQVLRSKNTPGRL